MPRQVRALLEKAREQIDDNLDKTQDDVEENIYWQGYGECLENVIQIFDLVFRKK